MSLFIPHICNVEDRDVPLICPCYAIESTRDGLSDDEKQFLLDVTSYHEMSVEYGFLRAMKAIIDQFPGTQHPLLADKLADSRDGYTNEEQVAALLNRQPELCKFLRRCSFQIDRRFPFVADYVERERQKVNRLLVACENCEFQYLVLTDDYYQTTGLPRSR